MPMQDVFRVVVDGFTAAELGVTGRGRVGVGADGVAGWGAVDRVGGEYVGYG